MTPPRLGRYLMGLVTSAKDRSYALSDLEEDFELIARRHGPGPARRWYWRQVFSSVLPGLRRRLASSRPAIRQRTVRPGHNRRVLDSALQDLQFAGRMLHKKPVFATVAILTLALGLGATTGIFSLVNGVLLKDVPGLTRTAGLVLVSQAGSGGGFVDMSYPVFTHLREHSDVTDDMAAFAVRPVAVGRGDEPQVHGTLAVTGNYFPLLGLQPAIGRFPTPETSFFPTVAPTVVISHELWEKRFGADPSILGETLHVNGNPVDVIGVAPVGFRGHHTGLKVDVFIPLGLRIPGLETAASLQNPGSAVIEVMGRLRDGVTPAQAQAALTTQATSYMQEQVSGTRPFDVRVDAWTAVPPTIRGGVTAFLTVLMAIVTLVLVMACVNVAGMILSRTTERRNEIGIRLALGAGRRRIVRQLVTESLVLFAGAGMLGVAFSLWATRVLFALRPPLPPGFTVDLDLSPDWRVMGFAVTIAMLTGLLFSLTPALNATRPRLVRALRDDPAAASPGRSRLRGFLVGTQMAVTLLLLVVAGLFIRALRTMESLHPGWRAAGVYAVSLDLELTGTSTQRGREFYDDLLARVTRLPGVEAAGLARKLPLAGRSSFGDVNAAGVDAPAGRSGFDAFLNRVSPGYFRTLDIPLLQGRDIEPADLNGAPLVAVINRTMAGRLWPGEPAVGKRFYTGAVGQGTGYEVVGVVENAKYNRLGEETLSFYYLPYRQFYDPGMTLHVRVADGSEDAVLAGMRAAIRALDPSLPVPVIQSLEESLGLFFLPQRMAAWVAGVMGLVGLVLGAVGVYGVTAFAIGQRTREIGVRIALGARADDVMRLITRQGMRAPLLGMAVGFAAAIAVTRFLAGLLAGVSPFDPLTFSAVAVGLAVVALSAVLIPARRAARVDAMVTLRTE
jgi:predicted permease